MLQRGQFHRSWMVRSHHRIKREGTERLPQQTSLLMLQSHKSDSKFFPRVQNVTLIFLVAQKQKKNIFKKKKNLVLVCRMSLLLGEDRKRRFERTHNVASASGSNTFLKCSGGKKQKRR